jgi:hypothetical protein
MLKVILVFVLSTLLLTGLALTFWDKSLGCLSGRELIGSFLFGLGLGGLLGLTPYW